MVAIEPAVAEKEIIKIIKEINDTLEAGVAVDSECCPGVFFKSQVLVTAIGRVAAALNVIIPNNCYIFFNKQAHKQLSIKESALKLIKEAKNGN